MKKLDGTLSEADTQEVLKVNYLKNSIVRGVNEVELRGGGAAGLNAATRMQGKLPENIHVMVDASRHSLSCVMEKRRCACALVPPAFFCLAPFPIGSGLIYAPDLNFKPIFRARTLIVKQEINALAIWVAT